MATSTVRKDECGCNIRPPFFCIGDTYNPREWNRLFLAKQTQRRRNCQVAECVRALGGANAVSRKNRTNGGTEGSCELKGKKLCCRLMECLMDR